MSARWLLPFLLQELLGNKGAMSLLAALYFEHGCKGMFQTSVGLSQRGHTVVAAEDNSFVLVYYSE